MHPIYYSGTVAVSVSIVSALRAFAIRLLATGVSFRKLPLLAILLLQSQSADSLAGSYGLSINGQAIPLDGQTHAFLPALDNTLNLSGSANASASASWGTNIDSHSDFYLMNIYVTLAEEAIAVSVGYDGQHNVGASVSNGNWSKGNDWLEGQAPYFINVFAPGSRSDGTSAIADNIAYPYPDGAYAVAPLNLSGCAVVTKRGGFLSIWGQCYAEVVGSGDNPRAAYWRATSGSTGLIQLIANLATSPGPAAVNGLVRNGTGSANNPTTQPNYPSKAQFSAGNGKITGFSYAGIQSGGYPVVPFSPSSVYGYRFSQASTSNLFTTITNLGGVTNVLELQMAGLTVGTLTNGESFTFTNLPGGGASQFDVIWQGRLGGVGDAPAVLSLPLGISGTNASLEMTLLSPPGLMVVMEPVGSAYPQGVDVGLSVAALSDDKIQYQWQLNGTNIISATNASLLLPDVQPVSSGDYRTILVDSSGSVTSAVAHVSVAPGSSVPPLLLPSTIAVTNQAFGVQLQLEPGKAYRVQSSLDLTGWLTVTNFIATSILTSFADPMVGPRRFYRIISP
jgi:hypothetical protein